MLKCLRFQHLLVNYRIGSLENNNQSMSVFYNVNYRIGSLEKLIRNTVAIFVVNYRIGSLES